MIRTLYRLMVKALVGERGVSETGNKRQEHHSRPAAIYLGNNTVITRTIWGHRMFVDSRDVGIGVHLITEGVWERWIAERFKASLHPGATVIEVGANVGYYTLLGASIIGTNGKYYAFEANPRICKLLYWSVDINGYRDRVTILNKVAYSDHRNIRFHILDHYPGSSSIHGFSRELLDQVHDVATVIEAEAIPLDEVFADDNIQVDLIKIDAEGSEPHVLRGMRKLLERSQDVKIICEFSPAMISGSEKPESFVEFLRELGFRFWRIENPDGNLTQISVEELLRASHIEIFMQR